jgi:ribosomal protein S18 acetylase RimI-like enzyme
MNEIKIRRAEEKDINSVNKLLFQVNAVHQKGRPDLFIEGGKKYDDEQLSAIFSDDNTPVLVAIDDEQVVGYAFCILQQPQPGHSKQPIKTLYIDDLCVDAECRGKHIGTLLYNAVINMARQMNCYNITLNVWTCNPSAIGFYEHLGLKPQKIGMEAIL